MINFKKIFLILLIQGSMVKIMASPIQHNIFGNIRNFVGGLLSMGNYFSNGARDHIEFIVSKSSNIEVLKANYCLARNSMLKFINEDQDIPKSITLDGQGFCIDFAVSSDTLKKYITLDPNLTVILKNIVLENFNPALIKFFGSGPTQSRFVFDENVFISLRKDMTIDGIINAPFIFQGNAKIIGNNSILFLTRADAITLTGAKVLTLQNIRLVITDAQAIKCLTEEATIVLEDVEINLTSVGYNLGIGNLVIKNYVQVLGRKTASKNDLFHFSFTSPGILKISEESTLGLYNEAIFCCLSTSRIELGPRGTLNCQSPEGSGFSDGGLKIPFDLLD